MRLTFKTTLASGKPYSSLFDKEYLALLEANKDNIYGGSFGALAYGSLGGTFLASENAWLGKETGVEFRPCAVQVPEPGTLGVLALGGMIVASVTRRRP